MSYSRTEGTGGQWQTRDVTKTAPTSYAQIWATGTRVAVPLVGDEGENLTAVLDGQRKTFELECSGVPLERLSAKGSRPPA